MLFQILLILFNMKNLFKKISGFIFLSFYVFSAICCDNSTIIITNQTNNPNGSITYDLDLYIELGTLDAVFYGYLLSFNSSTTSPIVDVSGAFPTTTLISNSNGTIVAGSISGTLQGVTGSNINSVVNDSDWAPFVGMSNVLSFESNQLFGATSNSLTMQVQVTVMGCVEEIEFHASVNSGSSSCIYTAITGQNCCLAPNLIVTDPPSVCSPNTIDLTTAAVTTGSDPGTLSYWTDSSATNTLLNPGFVGSGTYYIQLESSGCSSIQPVNVVVNSTPNLIITNPIAVCSPSLVDLTASAVTAGSDPGNLSYWLDPQAANLLNNPSFVSTGLFYIQLESNGCTSLSPVSASVLSNSTANFNASICPGESVTYNGTLYDANNLSGTEVLTASNGCDSIVTVSINLLSSSTANYNATICPGGSIVYNGTIYDATNLSGTEVLMASNGCDSIVAVSISVQSSISSNYTATICQGDSLVYNGTTYNAANLTGSDTLVSAGGCDSIVTVDITMLMNVTGTVNATVCYGESFVYNGVTYNASNLFGIDTLQSASGCDSIVTITVTELPYLESSFDTVVCNGESFEFNGTLYGNGNFSGAELLTSASGCDSVVLVNVIEYPIYSSVVDTVISGSQTFEFNGLTYSQDNPSSQEMFLSSTGCDSIVYVNVVFENESIYFIPNGFSPNADGINDYLYVMGGGLQEINFKVFNRWGQLVFETDCCCQENCGWDGTLNGQRMNNGTYVYLFEAIDFNGLELFSKGTISLIK